MEIEYLKNILSPLTQFPVRIEKKLDNRGIFLTIHSDTADRGKIIGREGVNIKAIRQVMRFFGEVNRMRISVRVFGPLTSKRNQ